MPLKKSQRTATLEKAGVLDLQKNVWTDPDFDASLKAFYYARFMEIPTPRWTAYDAKYYGIEMEEEVPIILQERAYTSPIWYTPKG